MPGRTRITCAVACAVAALAVPVAASAATLNGTVVGQPALTHGRVVVPVLLNAAGARTAGRAVSKISVPAKRGLRTSKKSIAAGDLRIGDRVKASVGRVSARERVAVLRITKRGAALAFGRLTEGRSQVTATVEQALAAVDQLKANPMTLLNPATPADSNSALRLQLFDVRYGLNLLIADMRTTAGGIDSAVATIERNRPTDPSRLAAVARQQKSLLDGLTQSADASRTAAGQLDDSVARLDETINSIGGASSPSIGINEVATVSDILHAVLELLRSP